MSTKSPRAADLAALDAKINEFLPPRYQHCYGDVSPESMGSASLKYGPDGKIAWDSIWTTFCDLALAGGPPHRGKLLEPPLRADVEADPARRAEVAEELDRAIGLTSGMVVVEGAAPEWVGVPCESVAAAAWLQFAVTAENVSARRRGSVLQLPAGPAFRPEKEIKNVVVALAKSIHYWDGHLSDAQQRLVAEAEWEPATPTEAAQAPDAYEAAALAVEEALRAAGGAIAPRRYVGWAGVETSGEDEAVWLLRAVLVEQVLVRREDSILYFPVVAAPSADDPAGRVGRVFGRAKALWDALASNPRRR